MNDLRGGIPGGHFGVIIHQLPLSILRRRAFQTWLASRDSNLDDNLPAEQTKGWQEHYLKANLAA
jgi:hypothetical protein